MSLLQRLRNTFRERRLNAEFEEEIRSHIEERAAELEQNGATAEEALAEARRRFGNSLAQREAMNDAKVVNWLADLRRDIGFGFRTLRRNPCTALVVVGSLSLAIGATCAVFSVLNALVLRPLPVKDPEGLVHFYVPVSKEGRAPIEDDSFSYPLFLRMREAATDVAELFAASMVNTQGVRFETAGESQPANIQCISGNAFSVLGLAPSKGRLLMPQDDLRPGAHPVAVVSFDFWRRKLGADPEIAGRTLTLDGRTFVILGVAPKGFTGIDIGTTPDIWIPLTMWQPAEGLLELNWRNFRVMGRMQKGTPIGQLSARMQPVYAEASKAPTPSALQIRPSPTGPSRLRGRFVEALWLLCALAGLVLLVACCNATNLMLAKASARRREMSLRVSLGASRGRLARQAIAESLVVGVLASAGGLAIAQLAAPVLVTLLADSGVPTQLALQVDWRIMGFLLLSCLTVTLFCGLLPAVRAFHEQPSAALRGVSGSFAAAWAGRILVSVQVALSFVLIVSCVVFAATLRNLVTAKAGFRSENLFLIDVRSGAPAENDEKAKMALEDLRARAEQIPGVDACAYSRWGIFSGNRNTNSFSRPGQGIAPAEAIVLGISPRFFETMGTRLIEGRDFLPGDRATGDQPVIINESIAKQYFGAEDPIGRILQSGRKDGGPKYRIIGVVEDVKYRSMRDAAPMMIYTIQGDARRVTFAVRCRSGTLGLVDRFKAAAAEVNAGLRVGKVETQSEAVQRTLARELLLAKLSGFFALAGVVLAAIGVYGVLNYTVVRRTRELGIRTALGASNFVIANTVVQQLAPAFVIGTLTGVVATCSLARMAQTHLFGIEPRSMIVLAAATAVLAAVGTAAALLPTRRAMRIDPAIALRME